MNGEIEVTTSTTNPWGPDAPPQSTAADRHLHCAGEPARRSRRTGRFREPEVSTQLEQFIRELLPVIDELERALVDPLPPVAGGSGRVSLPRVLGQVLDLLRRHGVEPENGAHQPFDPLRHVARIVCADPSQPDRTVLEVRRRGYCRGAEVIRPAEVVVNRLGAIPVL